ncbi:MAG: formimidoylglutamase, partial [Flammeovirgaceae bacterium]
MSTSHIKPNRTLWTGRDSVNQLYLHEKVAFVDKLNSVEQAQGKAFALLGYAADEGVRRNQGRVGAKNGPETIRKALTKQANHLNPSTQLVDCGDIVCHEQEMEAAHEAVSTTVSQLITQNYLPILLGGGHDLSFAHYRGILNQLTNNQRIGIINLDAHFDLRTKVEQGNSGTPFYQIATELASDFHYLCLGIQRQSNTQALFDTAEKLGVDYVLNTDYHLGNWENIAQKLTNFINQVDHIYLTIDLDGFSSSIAPGVSAPSPLGFSWEVAYQTIRQICGSKKLISMDIVELNPSFDVDLVTARLAAGIIYHVMDWLDG